MKTKIIIATHKEYHMPEETIYLPVHAGKSISVAELPYQGDDTGKHISEKNPSYCELTALYWAWKNLDADYIGLAHYRRHFTVRKPSFTCKDKFPFVLTTEEAERLLDEHDILLPKKRNYFIETGYSHYIHSHPAEALDKTMEIIHEICPEYDVAFDIVMNSSKAHRFNMFIMKKEILDSYCNWLFAVLFELEQRLDISSYDDYNKRVFGFIGERLLDVYLLNNGLDYKEIDVMFMENEHWIKKGFHFIKRIFVH